MTVIAPLAGHLLVEYIANPECVLGDRTEEVEPLSFGRVLAVSEEAASKGLKVGDKIFYTSHEVSGFKVDGISYLSLEVQHVGAVVIEE